MISMPVKPIASADTRRRRMVSFRIKMARTVPNSGVTKNSAASLASGVCFRARKNMSMDAACTAPRRRWRPTRRVRRGKNRWRTSSGKKNIKPNRDRKKPISNGCRSSDRWRVTPFIIIKTRADSTIKAMPRWVADRFICGINSKER